MHSPQHVKADAMLASAQDAAMFPFEDENDDLQWDEYGAALRPDEFQLKATSRTGRTYHPNSGLLAVPLPEPKSSCVTQAFNQANKVQQTTREEAASRHAMHKRVNLDWHAAAILKLLQWL